MLSCSRCGTQLDEKSTRCPICGKTEEKYGMYRKRFEAKRMVYLRRMPN